MGSPSQRPRDRRRWVGLGHLRALTFPPGASEPLYPLAAGRRAPPTIQRRGRRRAIGPAAPNVIRTSNAMTGLVELLAADLNFSLLARARGAGQRAAGN